MYPDYQCRVLTAYQKGCSAQILSLHLRTPSPANLREACAETCRQRFDRKDQAILSAFFGPHEDQAGYLKAIERCDIDRFKPLSKFVKGQVRSPHPKHIELLAWLVDVQPRPFQHGVDYTLQQPSAEQINIGQQPTDVQTTSSTEVVPSPGEEPRITYHPLTGNRRSFLVLALLALALVAGFAWWWAAKPTGSCMYWAGDHYTLVDCNRKIDGVQVIAADENLLHDFKKITRTDTITPQALGHVWYSKINNDIEYFTADGFHPVHIQYHLKPLTLYMYQHHLQH